MKPLRRKNKRQVTYDPYTNQDREWELEQSQDVLSSEGSVDSDEFVRKSFKDCGCAGDVGGICRECGAVSCTSCFGRCYRCKKPLCLEHSYFLKIKDTDVRFCGGCHDEVSWELGEGKFKRTLKSLIFDMEDTSHDR